MLTRRRRRTAGRRGFTLLEVLIALSIFVASAAILSRLVLLGLENAEFAERQTRAWLIAESAFANLDAGLMTTADVGVFPDDFDPNWQWSFTADALSQVGLYQVRVEVQHQGSGFSQVYEKLYFDEDEASEALGSSSESESTSGGSATP